MLVGPGPRREYTECRGDCPEGMKVVNMWDADCNFGHRSLCAPEAEVGEDPDFEVPPGDNLMYVGCGASCPTGWLRVRAWHADCYLGRCRSLCALGTNMRNNIAGMLRSIEQFMRDVGQHELFLEKCMPHQGFANA